MYVSLAHGMENPSGMDPPEGDAARCPQYTSSEEEQNRPAPTTEDSVAGKRPMALEPSGTEALPAETIQAPKRRRLVRIADDEEEEDEADDGFGHRLSKIRHSQLSMTYDKSVMYLTSYICCTELSRHGFIFISVMDCMVWKHSKRVL